MLIPQPRNEPNNPKREIKFLYVLKSYLDKYPAFGKPILNSWRLIRYLAWTLKWKIKNSIDILIKKYDPNIDINKVLWISPKRLQKTASREFSINNYKGTILGGDWDLSEKRFEDLDVFIAFKEVLLNKKCWPETIYYQRILSKIEHGEILWGCRNKSDLDARCQGLERLFTQIKNNGYKTQKELMDSNEQPAFSSNDDEIIVSIGRSGELLFSDGAHRLAIAKLLNLDLIPAKVSVRHTEWVKFRKELIDYAQGENGKLYQPAIHPDLSDIPAYHNCEDRFLLIKHNMSISGGKLLDLGANLGYFCHKFEDLGFECNAVEDWPAHLYFLNKLKMIEHKNFKIISESILDSAEIQNTEYSVVLALNIFHHFVKTRQSYEKFISFLQNLKASEIYFEPHLPDEGPMLNVYKNYSPEEFVRLIQRQTHLTNCNLLGHAEDNRPLYKIY